MGSMRSITTFWVVVVRVRPGSHVYSFGNTRNMSQQTNSSRHPDIPSYSEVLEARERIAPHVHRTPVFTSSYLDQLTGRKLFFKCENFQKTGSFKARGALNAVLKLKEKDANCKGVVCHSSGNHAQAMAYASSIAGIPCTVVIPNTAPHIKRAAIKGYGAHLEFCEPTIHDRKRVAGEQEEQHGYTQISSHKNREVIAGQGSIGAELIEQVPELDAIFVCVSGGGMAAGISLAVKNVKSDCKIFLVEPEGKELAKSIQAGRRLWSGGSGYINTIADGIRVEAIGQPNFEMFMEHAEKDVYTVNDAEICKAMKLMWERMKMVIETSAAATVAAVLSEHTQNLAPSIQNIGVILCGGNVDLDALPWMNNNAPQ